MNQGARRENTESLSNPAKDGLKMVDVGRTQSDGGVGNGIDFDLHRAGERDVTVEIFFKRKHWL